MQNVRPPAVAGQFYPAEPRQLAHEVQQLLAQARTIAPHTSELIPDGHGRDTATDDKTGRARFPHPNPPPEGEGTNESLREFHVKPRFPISPNS